MGIYDRDYYRMPRSGGFGSFTMWSVTTWIILINVAVYFVDAALVKPGSRGFITYDPETGVIERHPSVPPSRPLDDWGYFSVQKALYQGQVWRFVTYQFLHANLSHLFFNMLGLYLFGPIVERFLGPRRYAGFYLSCGLAGALSFVVLSVGKVLVSGPAAPMVGASGAIFGVLLAASVLAPDTRVLIYFAFPVRLAVLAWVYIGIAAYTVISTGPNAGGEAAHLGGGLWGFYLIRNYSWLNFLDRLPLRRRGRARMRFRDWTQDMNH